MRVSKFTFEKPLTSDEICELSKHFSVFNHPNYSEIGQKLFSKASGMSFLREFFKIPKEHTIAMGDSGNDIMMLSEAGIAVAMGNACDEVKNISDFVTLTCDEGGVGYAIDKIIFGQKD